MLPHDIRVCARFDVPDVCAAHRATHLVSVTDPGVHVPTPAGIAADRHLRLQFTDTLDPAHPKSVKIGMIADLLLFARALSRDDRLVVHCEGGISRSSACAFLLAVQALPPDAAQAAMDALCAQRPMIAPNELVVEMGATLLDRDDLILIAQRAARGRVSRLIAAQGLPQD